MIYGFYQKPSGGIYLPPSIFFCVSADNEDRAVRISRAYDVEPGVVDCSCCGPRWSMDDEKFHSFDEYIVDRVGRLLYGRYSIRKSLKARRRVPIVVFVDDCMREHVIWTVSGLEVEISAAKKRMK